MVRWLSPIYLFAAFLCQSQPFVHEEPHHIPIIQNRFVRVLNVEAKEGDTTQFHIHANDIAYLSIKGSKVWLQELGKEGRIVSLPDDWIGSDTTYSYNPFVHRFANIGSNNFQLIAIEVLSGKFRTQEFMKLGKELYKNGRFNFQLVDEGMIRLQVPSILIELSEIGEIEVLDLLKPGRTFELIRTENLNRRIIIQIK